MKMITPNPPQADRSVINAVPCPVQQRRPLAYRFLIQFLRIVI